MAQVRHLALDPKKQMARVLIVDDSRATRAGLRVAFLNEGFDVATARDGVEALAYLNAGYAVDVIVLDLMMSGMDGWTFRRAQRRDPWLADIPVVVMSGLEPRAMRGATPVAAFQKPVNVNELVSTVRAICRRRRRFVSERK